MKNYCLWPGLAALVFVGCTAAFAGNAKPVRVLIFSGQNNHNWRETTPKLKAILETGGRFKVDITEHPEQCDAATFAQYDALLSNWNAFGNPPVTNWPAATRAAFLDFVRSGGGFVSVHAGSSSFNDWPEYQQLGGAAWGKGTGHGKMHTNQVRLLPSSHPITAGVNDFETYDEFWHGPQVFAGSRPLAEVTPKTEFGGSGKPEPVAFATSFEHGRGFTLLLGHDARAMESAGFQTLLQRGVEWAATGNVTVAGVNPLWNWVADPKQGKPYFHPLATTGGATLTALRPDDHPWHRGLWSSWKFINGVNYWEEDRQTGLSAGLTQILTNHIVQTVGGGAVIETALSYHSPGEPLVLQELRSLRVSPPDAAGDYFIDWTSEFVAGAEAVKLERTPLSGQPGGQSWGGYAGLSARLDAQLRDGVFLNSEGQSGVAATHGRPARWMDCGNSRGGIAILDHPQNFRHPAPWYVNQEMPFFSPAVLFNADHTIPPAGKLKLRYRIIVHSQPKPQAELERRWQQFSRE